MSRRPLVILLCASFSTGCVPVTEPVGDIDKAEPSEDLIGTWEDRDREPPLWTVDRPEVKGNPKGLMRLRVLEKGQKIEDLKPTDAIWFFTATVGKHTFANLLMISNKPKKLEWDPDFTREGDYARWAKHDQRGYWVGHLTIKGAILTTDPGNHSAFAELMKKEMFPEIGEFFKTPRGWLTAYLEKNGPAKIFTSGKGKNTLTRVDEKK
jgi:hypothetical protein